MKLVEALKLLRERPPEGAESFRAFLACGFTPLHLETFLGAHLRRRRPGLAVGTATGLYGDLTGSLRRLTEEPGDLDAAAVVIEWPDLDPRLGIRGAGSWSPEVLPDVLRTAAERAEWLAEAIVKASERVPLAVAVPTLPLPPASFEPGWQSGAFDLNLRRAAADLAARVSRGRGVRVISQSRLDERSPLAARLDVKSELTTGFPYQLAHASDLAEALATALLPPPPKKGLITDLDDTLWRGLVGEVGAEGVSWGLDAHSQAHALYQMLLGSLARTGVLVAVASKNEPEAAARALAREDLALSKDDLFPVEVGWGAKSEAVSRILRAWNVGADGVVFVDDSPIELAEVKAAHPDIECVEFPRGDDEGAYRLLARLRDLFGKSALLEEDALRLQTVRRSAAAAEEVNGGGDSSHTERFLEQAEAELTLSFDAGASDARAFELVNKTNQFNLNGVRYTEALWRRRLEEPGGFLMVTSYKDKYGPLGKIAVLAGRREGERLRVGTWVMSCRAFARRIEHRCLAALFERFGAREIEFDFAETPKNAPLRAFLREFAEVDGGGRPRLTRETFAEKCPPLYHKTFQTG
ncbi:MAG TPA: HAD-IIIC family phosphatase [Pyrinomonadaceae bacterium]|nr:HAD-IIIC family phosphatase [Pyrinomonadaceae bacterium]